MEILAIDTSDARGSVCLLRETETVAARAHETSEDYSEWLLPAVDEVLRASSMGMESLDLLAVSTGPGSFTGLRVGLTTVKAWAEVYDKRVMGVPRLEALAIEGARNAGFVAAYCDAQRGQVFGALYRRARGPLDRVEDELVISPEGFLNWVEEHAGQEQVDWVSLDPELVSGLHDWARHVERGDKIARCSRVLAPAIGKLARERARAGIFSDPLALDANYVRRSDAEIFWRGR